MNNTNHRNFNDDTTVDEVLEGIDLNGKIALVTGCSSGLGAETVRGLANKGAEVIMTVRDIPKAQKVIDKIKAINKDAKVAIEELELGSFDSIRAFAERFLAKYDELHILINNAGVMACPQSKTVDGFETHFGTNHLGHFLMTSLVAPALVPGARIVNVSSSAHQYSPVVFDDINFEKRAYNKQQAYGQSKTANILFTVELNKHLHPRKIEAFAIHPGVIFTNLPRHMSKEEIDGFRQRVETGKLKVKTVEAGAATQVYAATAPELAEKGGSYISDCRSCEVDDEKESTSVVRSYAVDPDMAAKLWQLSEEMVGNRFG